MSTQKVDTFVKIVDTLHNDDFVAFCFLVQEIREELPGDESIPRHVPAGKNHVQSPPLIFSHRAFPAADNLVHKSKLCGHTVVCVAHECLRQTGGKLLEFLGRNASLPLDSSNEINRSIDNSILPLPQCRVQLSRCKRTASLCRLLL